MRADKRPARQLDHEQLFAASNLTHSQLLFWLGQSLSPSLPLYNMALTFDIHGELDPRALRQALHDCRKHSDVLEARVEVRQGVPQMVASRDASWELAEFDFRRHQQPIDDAMAWAATQCQRPFDLARNLTEAALLRVADNRWLWYLCQHHVITDAWSMAELFHLVSKRYEQLEQGDATQLDIPAYSACRQHQVAQRSTEQFAKATSFWNQQSARNPDRLQLYGHRSRHRTGATRRIECVLGNDRWARLDDVAHQPGIRSLSVHLSRFNLIVTTLAAYLSRVSGQREFVIATPAHHRTSPDFRRSLGLFIEMFPVNIRVSPDDTFRTLLQRSSTEVTNYLRHAVAGSSGVSGQRGSDVVLNYIPVAFGEFAGRATSTSWLHPGCNDQQHQLRLQVHDFSDTNDWRILFDVDEGLAVNGLATQIPAQFLAVLDAMLRDLDAPIDRVPLLDQSQSHDLTSGFNTATTPRPPQTVVERFDRCVSQAPDRQAVVFEGSTWTYRELRDQALALAHLLTANGVTPGSRVIVAVPRSADLIAAVWGNTVCTSRVRSRHRGYTVSLDPACCR